MPRQDNPDHRKWRAILDDKDSPAELKSEARHKLGLNEPLAGGPPAVHYSDGLEYSSEIDALVESYWGQRKGELEQRHPIAERVYFAVFLLAGCGGGPSAADEARFLLPVLRNCKSAFMRKWTGRALLTAGVYLRRQNQQPELTTQIERALKTVDDIDLFDPSTDWWLGLCRKYSGTSDASTQEAPR